MGYSLVWLAVRGKSMEDFRRICGFEVTGVREEIQESTYTAVTTSIGWHIIVADHDGDGLVKRAMLQLVSASAEAVACEVEEHVMVSAARGWENGVQKWSVLHNCENRQSPLIESGILPSAFSKIKSELLAQQLDADKRGIRVDHVFDVPVELARELTGFRHDQDISGGEKEPFEVLQKISKPNDSSPKKSTFLKRLFGR